MSEKIFIAGHNGMVGSALSHRLFNNGKKLLTASRKTLDLLNQKSVENFMRINQPDIVVICAAKVGGILANNKYRADFIYNNTQITSNLIHFSHKYKVKKLINLGSSCIYPKECPQPIKEEYLLTSSLEYTNEPYAIAKINGLKMCESYFKQYGENFYSVMPCNLYGPNDNFDLQTSHVLPALIRKVHDAKKNQAKNITVWGTGEPLREFMHTHDLARALEFCINEVEAIDIYKHNISHLNIASDDEVSIKELCEIICEVIGFDGEIVFDLEKPNGTMRKKMDNSRIKNLNFKQQLSLKEGIKQVYESEHKKW